MSHPKAANKFLQDEARAQRHDQSLWFVREKRDKIAQTIDQWEDLRDTAAQIKAHTLANLDRYLLQFEENAIKNGIQVHWAKDAEEHNQIVHSILAKHKVQKLVKSKSMLTEECHMNPYLEARGIEVTDTDLGEWIVQLAKEPPSHIVMPAIHKTREDIDALFHEKIGTKLSGGDEKYLTSEARKRLREKFLQADAAITGVNFALADKGGFVVCTNEGNADMGTHLAPVHIACMGIEKIIPRMQDLGVFLRLLARSATGQPITTYSSHFFAPRKGTALHVVIVDNGRTKQLQRESFRNSLRCIRCGACMNTCPVYRRSGGHSYNAVVPGPIGAILNPGFDLQKHSSLPFASSLCGSCTDVCPVKIDIHKQLYKWRQMVTEEKVDKPIKRMSMHVAGNILAKPSRYRFWTKLLHWMPLHKMNLWGKTRALPRSPKQTFNEWYAQNRKR